MSDLLGNYTTGMGDLSSTVSNVLMLSLFGSVGFIIVIILYYVFKNIRQNKIRRDDDLKLQSYFELYSDVIADKVVKKINEQNKQ